MVLLLNTGLAEIINFRINYYQSITNRNPYKGANFHGCLPSFLNKLLNANSANSPGETEQTSLGGLQLYLIKLICFY